MTEGWQCPKCSRCYAPTTPACNACNDAVMVARTFIPPEGPASLRGNYEAQAAVGAPQDNTA